MKNLQLDGRSLDLQDLAPLAAGEAVSLTVAGDALSAVARSRGYVESIVQRDRMVITGGILVMSVIFVTVNLIVDLSYGFFDPRVRHGRG